MVFRYIALPLDMIGHESIVLEEMFLPHMSFIFLYTCLYSSTLGNRDEVFFETTDILV